MDIQKTEEGEEYLNKLNFRSLIEWITAETLLSRPNDPLLFIRTIIDNKISLRDDNETFHSEHPIQYVKECYAKASGIIDENDKTISKE